jgi:diguanylate cyclase (GGDEF)-like protein/PAS domain S-box-containing protein
MAGPRLSPASRVTVALVCLTLSLLALAAAAGLVPDRHAAILEGRKVFCEQLAIHCSLAAQRGDLSAVRAGTLASARRHPELLSAAVRAADDRLVVQSGEHPPHWDEADTTHSPATHMRVPITLHNRLWGHVELRFRAPDSPPAWSPFRSPLVPLLVFVAFGGLLAYSLYVRALFRKMGDAQASIIPRRVRTTLNTLAEGVVVLDKDQRIALANEAFARLVGAPAGDLQGRKVSELSWAQHPGEADGLDEEYPWERSLGDGATQMGTILRLRHDDEQRTLSVNSTPILGDDGAPRGAFATFDNLTAIERKNAHLRKLLVKLRQSRAEVKRQNQELQVLATRDPLTGCLNRRAFFADFETHWSAADRYAQPLACVMLDIDHFKSINDAHGHATGDRVLQLVAEMLRTMVRKSDLVCRYGGEEFCVLLPHTGLDEAAQAAERFRQGIAARDCSGIAVTASLGVSAAGLGARQPRQLLDQADRALYAAKRVGRNRVVRWDEIVDRPEFAEAEVKPVAPPDAGAPIPFHAVAALLSALGYRHADTAEHSRRVADLCVATAAGLVTQTECYVLEVAALLHDIGKLGVPDAVLLKPGPLTPDEWKVMRTHEEVGDEIVGAAFTSPGLSAIIRNHHCWYAGAPHDPELPHGEDIPLGARVLSIADAYDAIVSDRVYRKGRSRAEAFAELRRCAGLQFDPGLVERFIAAVQARDESRAAPELAVTKQTALKIGVQIERLASALDAQDTRGLATMAGYLNATARAHGLGPIAEVAARLEQTAGARPDRVEITQLTLDLMDLCRATYRSYLQHSCCGISA